jgi:putative ABC transport system permease protein
VNTGMHPILSAMRRNKFGALLIAVQMAVTLAFLVNALTLIEQRLAWSARPTGIDEADIFVISSDSIDHPDGLAARQAADLQALRSLNGVSDAYVTNDYPLQGGGWAETVQLTADQQNPSAMTAYYFGDEHALGTLGLTLVAGRNFSADEVSVRTDNDVPHASGYIVTKQLAMKLFPAGNALGQSIFVENTVTPSPIIGIVDRLQGPYTAATGMASTFTENSVLVPYRPVGEFSRYMVRVQPAQLARVMKSAEQKLFDIDGDRILHSQSMVEQRIQAYRGARGLVVLLCAVCAALVIVTAFGIVGLTSYWVAQRRQQIGIRRALGATRSAILRHFQTENFMIAAAGAFFGVVFAIMLNLWMVRSFEMVRMDYSRAIAGAVVMLLLGQIAVLWPALRAASIPPALATRGG